MPTNGRSQRVAIIGGGPAGATVATLVAKAGHAVDLFERERFPRFKIGESLIPNTYWILDRLGMLPKLRQSAFVKKYSVQFIGESGKLSEPFYFHDYNPHESSQTWQVRRSEFDSLMLDNAVEHGARVHFGARVLDVHFDGDWAVGIRTQTADRSAVDVPVDVVVDCSGQSSMLISRLGLRQYDPALRKAAVWTYWRGAQRGVGIAEGATLVCQTAGKLGWFWYIPLHDDIVSVGVVASDDFLFKNRSSRDLEAIFNEEVERCPAIKERIAGAERADDFRAAKEFSYRSAAAAGNGWVAAGDAYGFLDPLYSSGVLLALKSGELAADAIIDGLRDNDVSGSRLGAWQTEYNRGMDRMRNLVCEFYDGLNFGKFVRRFPQLKARITDILIGDLFKDEIDELWEPLAQFRAEEAAAAKPMAKAG